MTRKSATVIPGTVAYGDGKLTVDHPSASSEVVPENQISYIVPQQIGTALSSEVGLSSANQADVLALGMIVLVAVVMTGYTLLQRRTARWLR